MKWTTKEGGKIVKHEMPSGAYNNPPCQTKRCQRRREKKGFTASAKKATTT